MPLTHHFLCITIYYRFDGGLPLCNLFRGQVDKFYTLVLAKPFPDEIIGIPHQYIPFLVLANQLVKDLLK